MACCFVSPCKASSNPGSSVCKGNTRTGHWSMATMSAGRGTKAHLGRLSPCASAPPAGLDVDSRKPDRSTARPSVPARARPASELLACGALLECQLIVDGGMLQVQPPQRRAKGHGCAGAPHCSNTRSQRASTIWLRAFNTRASTVSPCNAPSTNRAPSTKAMPRPSWASRSMLSRCFLPTGTGLALAAAGLKAQSAATFGHQRPLRYGNAGQQAVQLVRHKRRSTDSGHRDRR